MPDPSRLVARLDPPSTPYPRTTSAVRPGTVIVIVAAVLGCGLGTAAFADEGGVGGVALAVVIQLLVLVGLGVVGVLLAYPRRGRLEITSADGRLWLPAVAPLSALRLAGLCLSVALGVVVLVGLAVDGGRRAPVAASAGAVVVATASLRVLVRIANGRAPLTAVGLGPEDLVRRSGRAAHVMAWADVASVDTVTDPAPRVVVRGARPAAGELPVATNLHGSDPRLVALLLRHYLHHPGDRHELGTAAAQDRVLRGDLRA